MLLSIVIQYSRINNADISTYFLLYKIVVTSSPTDKTQQNIHIFFYYYNVWVENVQNCHENNVKVQNILMQEKNL